MADLGIVAGMSGAWQALDDAVYTPWEAAADAKDYAQGQVADAKAAIAEARDYVKTELPDIVKDETALGLGTLAIATLGALVVGGGTLYLLSEGKATNGLIRTLDPSRALKGFKVGF